jgi:hypothetical protein
MLGEARTQHNAHCIKHSAASNLADHRSHNHVDFHKSIGRPHCSLRRGRTISTLRAMRWNSMCISSKSVLSVLMSCSGMGWGNDVHIRMELSSVSCDLLRLIPAVLTSSSLAQILSTHLPASSNLEGF